MEELEGSYLEVSILLRTEEIELDWRTGQLRSQYQSLIWRIMSKFSEKFKQTGVYFTNEVTDGVPWEAVVSGNNEGLWAFDAAILPTELFEVYRDCPAEMFISMNEKVMYLVRKSVWGTEP